MGEQVGEVSGWVSECFSASSARGCPSPHNTPGQALHKHCTPFKWLSLQTAARVRHKACPARYPSLLQRPPKFSVQRRHNLS